MKTRIFPLAASLFLAFLTSCGGAPQGGDPQTRPDVPRKKTGVGDPYGHPGGRHMLIAWLDEFAGNAPPEYAEKIMTHPRRFALYGDGTVEYRDDRFSHWRVKLNSTELEQLVHFMVDTKFLEIESLFSSDKERDSFILDAPWETIGLEIGGKKKELTIVALAYTITLFPDNPNLPVCKELRDRMASFQHLKAAPFQP